MRPPVHSQLNAFICFINPADHRRPTNWTRGARSLCSSVTVHTIYTPLAERMDAASNADGIVVGNATIDTTTTAQALSAEAESEVLSVTTVVGGLTVNKDDGPIVTEPAEGLGKVMRWWHVK